MKICKIILLVIFLCTLLCQEYGGFSGSEYRYGYNARGFSLGGALVAENNTAFRQFSNPSLISHIKKNEFGISLFNLTLDRSLETISFGMHLPPKAGIGFSLFRSGTKNIISRDFMGNPGEEYSVVNNMGMMSFAVQFNKRLSIGLNIKIFHNNYFNEMNSNGIGIDFGLSYLLNNRINLGMRLENIFGKHNWKYSNLDNTEKNYSIYLPKKLSFGSRIEIFNIKILSQIDMFILPIIKKINDDYGISYNAGIFESINNEILWVIPKDSYNIRIGFEKQVYDNLILRSGLNSQKFVLGFGTKVTVWKSYDLLWDYAIDPGISKEGISHNFSWILEI